MNDHQNCVIRHLANNVRITAVSVVNARADEVDTMAAGELVDRCALLLLEAQILLRKCERLDNPSKRIAPL